MDSLRVSDAGLPEAELSSRAKCDGYLYCPSLVDRDKVATARARVLDACARRGWREPGARPVDYHHPEWVSLQAELLHSPQLNALRTDDALLNVLHRFMGHAPLILHADVIRVAFPGAPPTPAHQDAHYLRDDAIWIAWLPLVETSIERGPLAVIPGSHSTGLRPHLGDSLDALSAELRPDDAWCASPLSPGDALLFHSLTVHRALPNHSTALRLSVDFRFR